MSLTSAELENIVFSTLNIITVNSVHFCVGIVLIILIHIILFNPKKGTNSITMIKTTCQNKDQSVFVKAAGLVNPFVKGFPTQQ